MARKKIEANASDTAQQKQGTSDQAHKSLEERIQEKLRASGYPTEIVSATQMQKLGWRVTHSPTYLSEQGQNREIDIFANREWLIPHWPSKDRIFRLVVFLTVECKRSGIPRVLFAKKEGFDVDRS